MAHLYRSRALSNHPRTNQHPADPPDLTVHLSCRPTLLGRPPRPFATTIVTAHSILAPDSLQLARHLLHSGPLLGGSFSVLCFMGTNARSALRASDWVDCHAFVLGGLPRMQRRAVLTRGGLGRLLRCLLIVLMWSRMDRIERSAVLARSRYLLNGGRLVLLIRQMS